MMAELQGTPCRSTSCDHNKVLFVNKYLLSPCATSQHFKSLDQRFQHTLAWRTDTMENVCGSVPSPPYWWSTDQCQLTLAQTVNIRRVAPRARLSNYTRICVLQRSRRKLLLQAKWGRFVEYDWEGGRTTRRAKSLYLRVQEGHGTVSAAGSPAHKTLVGGTHDRGGHCQHLF